MATPGGQQIPLKELADIREASGASFVYRENNERYIGVQYSIKDRDLAGAVEDAQRQVAQAVSVPTGYHMVWGGEYENYTASRKQLQVIVPVTILLIFMLLFMLYSNFKFPLITVIAVVLSSPVGGLLALSQGFSVTEATKCRNALQLRPVCSTSPIRPCRCARSSSPYSTIHSSGMRPSTASGGGPRSDFPCALARESSTTRSRLVTVVMGESGSVEGWAKAISWRCCATETVLVRAINGIRDNRICARLPQ